MFKWKIYLYKNVGGKEKEIKKKFTSEKKFNEFLEKNPEFKKMDSLKWGSVKWPSLSNFKDVFDDLRMLETPDFMKWMVKDIEDMEKQMKKIFGKSKKLLK